MENSKCGNVPMQRVHYTSAIGSIMYAIWFLFVGGNPKNELKVTCYNDANFQTNKDDTKSQSGYVFMLNGGAVGWKSAKQSTIVVSSTEAKYIVVVEASMEAVWMWKFIDGLGNVMPTNKRPMKMLCDNTVSISIANDLRIFKGAMHYQRKYHYILEVIKNGEIVLDKVHINDNIADPFTKLIPYTKHFEHAIRIGVRPASSLM
ncbi:hypothetical protein Tco_0516806 [Tanacetum coccineum]